MKKKCSLKNKSIKNNKNKIYKYQSKNIEIIKYINEQENFDNAKQVLKKKINEYKYKFKLFIKIKYQSQ